MKMFYILLVILNLSLNLKSKKPNFIFYFTRFDKESREYINLRKVINLQFLKNFIYFENSLDNFDIKSEIYTTLRLEIAYSHFSLIGKAISPDKQTVKFYFFDEDDVKIITFSD
jgi:hypothetical protein